MTGDFSSTASQLGARRPRSRAPKKPHPDFPLTANPLGTWSIVVDGKLLHFGSWSDPFRALAEYVEWAKASKAAVVPRPSLALGEAVKLFLEAKQAAVDPGELSRISYLEYVRTCERLVAFLGAEKQVHDLTPDSFAAFKADRSKRLNIVSLGNEITRIKSLFRWLVAMGKLDKPMLYGPDFRKPSQRALRRHRRLTGKKLFTAQQIRNLLNDVGIQLRACILLGINCGFGPTDCGALPLDAVDLDSGWIEFPRPKTEVDRRIPIWQETVAALRAARECGHTPRPEADGRFLVMFDGQPWSNSDHPISRQFRQALQRLQIRIGTFYWLRHTLQTVGSGAKDQTALNAIFGHVDSSMAAVYRHDISDDRLVAVTNHVRTWLFDK